MVSYAVGDPLSTGAESSSIRDLNQAKCQGAAPIS
jgi:hypothetical protein